jgi:biotin carboxyl carrier protein
MAFEISMGSRTANINLLGKAGTKYSIQVDDIHYDLDVVMVERGVYSIIYKGNSYNLELIEGEDSKHYIVNSFARTFNIEVIDAETKYLRNRNQGKDMEGDKNLSSPMPGKVIKVLVSEGEQVTVGQTLVVVEAMKMQSEFKATADRVVKTIFVKEGDTVNAHQVMIHLE